MRQRRAAADRARAPQQPRLPGSLESASVSEHELEYEATFDQLAFEGDLSGRAAEAVEFAQCRLLGGADWSSTVLPRVRLTDCLVEKANLANLRTDQACMQRVGVTTSRLTGWHCIDGLLRDVVISECRADLTVFRFTAFQRVVFEGCHLAGADFTHADLSGAVFVDCDLSGAQFSQATAAGARFRGCTLSGVGGVTSLDGATIAGQDLIALSHTLATALGIHIEQLDDGPEVTADGVTGRGR